MRFWVRMAASNVVELRRFVMISSRVFWESWRPKLPDFNPLRTNPARTFYAWITQKRSLPASQKTSLGEETEAEGTRRTIGLAGWQLDRAGVSKVESRFIKVSDCQLLCLMSVLEVDAKALLPAIDPKKPIGDQIRKLMRCP